MSFLRSSLAVILLLLSCSASHAAPVRTGAQVLAEDGFSLLRGKKFALLTNATARVGGSHILDLMAAAGVMPALLMVPEHGLKGAAEDGVHVGNSVHMDIPVISLYGDHKKPRRQDLREIDLLVFDIQDVGARFYTYISTMGLAMQGAAEAGVPFMVLDRPNPLGGEYVAGFVREKEFSSFTALYPVPVAHGMTVGEMAMMVRGEEMLPGLQQLDLTVVRMEGWERGMRWPDTGLAWTPTSPNVPDFETALLYAGTGLLEATSASEGRGTREPFKLAGLPAVDGSKLAEELNALKLPGLRFEPATFTPAAIPGMSSTPKFRNRAVSGVRVTVTDHRSVRPVETGVSLLCALYGAVPAQRQSFFRRGLGEMAGSRLLQRSVEKGLSGEEIAALWGGEVAAFRKARDRYLLYGNGRKTLDAAAAEGR
ncbi:MAG TPA: DUF1343 domain-containing protein [Verrucomicrobiae bacterium]|nr:DUF1343 domain-containing protein [Verrucomicrobiae bacterium]